MKFNISAALTVLAAAALTSCANHDLIPEIAEVGQAVPTVYWEVGSTVCKAGESFTFKGKYTNAPGRTPLRSEVWYQIIRQDNATVSAKLGGLTYNQTYTAQETMRSYQCQASFPHKDEYWDGHQNILTGEVPVSRTLSPLSWVDASSWDQERFDTYYPEGFTDEFLTTVLGYLTDPATAPSYYNVLRNVFLNYNFTNEQLAVIGQEGLDLSGDDGGTAVKSDAWFTTSEPTDEDIVGVYFITYDAENNVVYNERPADYTPAEGEVVYPVYEAAEWVFCRYDDNTGSIANSVREEWLPKFRTLLEFIPFQDWIYDSGNAVYKVEFSRAYNLEAQFRAYDKDTDRLNDDTAPEYEGITSPTELKTISIN